jgi:hypothetical protein
MSTPTESVRTRIVRVGNSNTGGFAYFLGWLASVIYFIQHATSFGDGILGILKAFIWPLFLVYKVLEFFHL